MYWDWKGKVTTDCRVRKPHLTLENLDKRATLLFAMTCPMEVDKNEKKQKKSQKYQKLCSEVRERQTDYKVKATPSVIGGLGDGMKNLKEDVKTKRNQNKQLVKNKILYWRRKISTQLILSDTFKLLTSNVIFEFFTDTSIEATVFRYSSKFEVALKVL